jgi:DNA gyrase/topoisomerase IV subunit B
MLLRMPIDDRLHTPAFVCCWRGALQMFTMLMGDHVAPRKEFINTHAKTLALDDLDF